MDRYIGSKCSLGNIITYLVKSILFGLVTLWATLFPQTFGPFQILEQGLSVNLPVTPPAPPSDFTGAEKPPDMLRGVTTNLTGLGRSYPIVIQPSPPSPNLLHLFLALDQNVPISSHPSSLTY